MALRYRAPPIPSIPTHAQSYGYEETRSGELVLQKPPHEGFSGCTNNSVLPGYSPGPLISDLACLSQRARAHTHTHTHTHTHMHTHAQHTHIAQF